MKKFLNNIKDEAGNLRLSVQEKSAMRAQIFGVDSSQASPYIFGIFSFSHNMRMAFAGVMLFVLAGGGTVSAAATALPGDLLYKIKLSVNEKVEVALAPNTLAKADVELKLAERRIEEAQSLAAKGRLDAQTAEALTVNFEAHASNALGLAEPEDTVGESDVVSAMSVSVATEAPVAPVVVRTAVSVDASASNRQSATTVAEVASTTNMKKDIPAKKSGKRNTSLRESLRIKSEILKEIKVRALNQESQADNHDGERDR